MTIDIQSEVNNLVSTTETSLTSLLTSKAPVVMQAIASYTANLKNRGAVILDYVANDSEDALPKKLKTITSFLEDEKGILESELLSFLDIALGIAEVAINNVQQIIFAAISKFLPVQAA